MQYLKDQAEVIKLFGNNSKQIWKNVIVIAKQGSRHSHKANFQVKRERETFLTGCPGSAGRHIGVRGRSPGPRHDCSVSPVRPQHRVLGLG